MFAFVRPCILKGEFDLGPQMLDRLEVGQSAAERGEEIAIIDAPFEPRPVAHAQDEIGLRFGSAGQRSEGMGVCLRAHPEIDVRREHSEKIG